MVGDPAVSRSTLFGRLDQGGPQLHLSALTKDAGRSRVMIVLALAAALIGTGCISHPRRPPERASWTEVCKRGATGPTDCDCLAARLQEKISYPDFVRYLTGLPGDVQLEPKLAREVDEAVLACGDAS